MGLNGNAKNKEPPLSFLRGARANRAWRSSTIPLFSILCVRVRLPTHKVLKGTEDQQVEGSRD